MARPPALFGFSHRKDFLKPSSVTTDLILRDGESFSNETLYAKNFFVARWRNSLHKYRY